jgi:hypothetical protein
MNPEIAIGIIAVNDVSLTGNHVNTIKPPPSGSITMLSSTRETRQSTYLKFQGNVMKGTVFFTKIDNEHTAPRGSRTGRN